MDIFIAVFLFGSLSFGSSINTYAGTFAGPTNIGNNGNINNKINMFSHQNVAGVQNALRAEDSTYSKTDSNNYDLRPTYQNFIEMNFPSDAFNVQETFGNEFNFPFANNARHYESFISEDDSGTVDSISSLSLFPDYNQQHYQHQPYQVQSYKEQYEPVHPHEYHTQLQHQFVNDGEVFNNHMSNNYSTYKIRPVDSIIATSDSNNKNQQNYKYNIINDEQKKVDPEVVGNTSNKDDQYQSSSHSLTTQIINSAVPVNSVPLHLVSSTGGHYTNIPNYHHSNPTIFKPHIVHPKSFPISKHVHVTRHVPVPVYRRIHVPIQKPVKVNIPHPVLLPVPQPYPIHVPIPRAVAVPIVKELTIPVEKIIPVPVERKIPYTVEKQVPYKVEKHITVHVPQSYPVKVPVIKTILHRYKPHTLFGFY